MRKKILFWAILISLSVVSVDLLGNLAYRLIKGIFVCEIYKQTNVFNVRPFTELVNDERVVTNKKDFSCVAAQSNIYTHVPGNLKKFSWEIRTDAFGFRSGSNKYYKDKENIVFIGDSVPFGWGIDGNKSVPSEFYDILTENGLSAYGVINAAIPSYSLYQAVKRYEYEIKGQFPVKCVVLQIFDPASQFVMWGKSWNKDINWSSRDALVSSHELVDKLRRKNYLISFLEKYSSIYHTVYALRLRIKKAPEMPMQLELSDEAAFDAFRKTSLQILEDFYAILKKDKIPLVILPVNPLKHLFCYSADEFKKLDPRTQRMLVAVDRLNRVLLEFSEAHADVFYLDLVAYFYKIKPDGLFLKDALHLSEKGSETEARFIFDNLRLNKLL